MDTTNHTGMLGKIRALLNKAEANGVTPAEAEALSAKAAELMGKYAIDHAMLDAARLAADRERPGRRAVRFAGETYAARKMLLLSACGRAGGCYSIRTDSDTIVMFGYEADLDMAVMLYHSLLVQAARALARETVPVYTGTRAFRSAWWLGYAARVGERLASSARRGQEDSARGAGPGTAVVLADRQRSVQAAARAEFPSTRNVRVSRPGSYAGYAGGQAAGSRADLGRTGSLGGGRRQLA